MLVVVEHKMSLAPILKYPDFMKEIAIKTDATQIVLGAALTQNTKLKVRRSFCLCCTQ